MLDRLQANMDLKDIPNTGLGINCFCLMLVVVKKLSSCGLFDVIYFGSSALKSVVTHRRAEANYGH